MLKRLASRFEASFPTEARQWRKVGREAEHPLVRADGSAADLGPLWPRLAEGGRFEATYEGALQTGLAGERFTYSSEVGKGTVEIIVGPHEDLHGTRAAYEEAMAGLLRATEGEDVAVLGYGIQPLTPPTPALMTPKRRYLVLYDVLGESWLYFALTASDQVHAEVSLGEMLAQCNLANALSAVTIALCANSPIYAGAPSGFMSAREGSMGTIRAEEHRHGMPLEPWRSALHIVETLADLPFLMSRRGAECNPVGDLFRRHLETGVSTEDEAWLDFLVHDHYMWHSARLRTAHATVELRSACQQPPDEHMAACALGFAMVCAGAELSAYLDEALGEGAWAALSRYRDAVVREGLAAREPAPGFLLGVLNRCEAALAARGRGEEVYLGPLYRRLEAQENPAQRVLKIFAQSGPTALVEALSWKR